MTRSRSDGPRSRSAPPAPRIAPAGPRGRADVLDWLESRVNFERQSPSGPGGTRSFGLGRMRRLLALLGSPHRALPVIHVAGTKGKGSTVAMIAAILERSGLRVGRYLSPHVHRLEERICVDSRPIPAAALERAFAAVIPAVERIDAAARRRGTRGPTWFEAVTAAAFVHFAHERVDVAVLETGLGGRLDATNVCRPLVSVITPVSLDHTAVLGPTVRHIATEKAGIVKRGCPLVCGARDPEARAVVVETARRRRTPLLLVDRDYRCDYVPPADPSRLDGGTLRYTPLQGAVGGESANYALAMAGAHQAENAGMAVATVRLLRTRGIRVPETAVRRALASVRLPARIERIASRPLVVVDAAHNAASMRSLVGALEEAIDATRRRGAPVVLVFAASADKAIEEMLSIAAGRFDRVVVTRSATSPRAAPIERLQAACAAAGLPRPATADRPTAALSIARKAAGSRGMICVAGSFFLAGELGTG